MPARIVSNMFLALQGAHECAIGRIVLILIDIALKMGCGRQNGVSHIAAARTSYRMIL
jgi:hypothetical protein